jgi:hypothetical protein
VDRVTKNADQRARGAAGTGRPVQPIVRAQLGAVHLPSQDRDLVAQHQQFDVLGAAVTGELGQHLQDLPDEQIHQRGAHGWILAWNNNARPFQWTATADEILAKVGLAQINIKKLANNSK